MRTTAKMVLLVAYTCMCVLVTAWICSNYHRETDVTFLGVVTSINDSLLHGLKDFSTVEKKQRIEDGKKVMYWLMQELYFRGDKYGYKYEAADFEALVLDIYRREKNLVYEEARKVNGAVPSYYYRHLRSFAGAIPLAEAGVNRHSIADFEMLVIALKELQAVDVTGFNKFVADNQSNLFVHEAVERIKARKIDRGDEIDRGDVSRQTDK
jgi:hypothetical protein